MEFKIVFCTTFWECELAALPCLAISCVGRDTNQFGGVGFEQSKETMKLRSELIKDWYHLDGNSFRKNQPEKCAFSPQVSYANRKGEMFVEPHENQEWNEQTSVSIANTLTSYLDRGHQEVTWQKQVNDLVGFADEVGVAIQYWPFFSEYWSFGMMFSQSLELMVSDLYTLAERYALDIEEINKDEFPVH